MVMTRQRVVLSIEQDLLDEAHVVAVRQHTSVNEMVRQYLKQVVRQERQRLEAWRDVQRLLDKPPVRLGAGMPDRRDRHER
jgi:metal-responsive CopG/Arc/MetJ family transcriptional regulator